MQQHCISPVLLTTAACASDPHVRQLKIALAFYLVAIQIDNVYEVELPDEVRSSAHVMCRLYRLLLISNVGLHDAGAQGPGHLLCWRELRRQ